MLRLQAWIERVRENLWFWPVLTALASVVLAAALAQVGPADGSMVDAMLVSPGAGSVRSLMATLLGAMVTAASVVSSLTLVALQTASTQFSPRLLRNFLRDRATQAVLALFVGTSGFLVTLIVEADDQTARLAVTIAFGLVFTSVVVVAYFFNHVSQSIRVESIMRSVTHEAWGATERLRVWLDTGRPVERTVRLPDHARPVPAPKSGYVQQIDAAALCHSAAHHRIVIRLVAQLGQPVTRDVAFAWWWDADGSASTMTSDRLAHDICSHVEIGYERTMFHDVALGMRQLVDMSIKAMSPAVNDPYTAMQAVDHLGAILVPLGAMTLGDHVWSHGDEERVIVPVATYAELAGLACDQLRRYGAREPAVLIRIMAMLRDVASADRCAHEAELRALVASCGADGEAGPDAESDRRLVDLTRHEILQWFDHREPPSVVAREGL